MYLFNFSYLNVENATYKIVPEFSYKNYETLKVVGAILNISFIYDLTQCVLSKQYFDLVWLFVLPTFLLI